MIGAGQLAAQQQSAISALLTQLRIPHHDSTTIDIHTQLASIYIQEEANAARGIDHANMALLLAENHRDERRQILAYDQLIKAQLFLKSDVAAALKLLEKAQAIGDAHISPLELACLKGDEGLIFMELGDYDRAFRLLLSQLQVYEKYKFEEGVANVRYDLGCLLFAQHNYQEALDYYQKALDHFELTGHTKGKVKSLNAIGQAKGRLGDFEGSVAVCLDALQLARALNARMEITRINANLGFAYRHLKRTDDAVRHYNDALDMAIELENSKLEGDVNLELADIFMQKNDLKEAGAYLELAKAVAEKNDSKSLHVRLHELLYPYYERTGRDREAYESLKKLMVYKEQLFSEEQNRNFTNSRMKFETEKREKEVKQLRAKELENQLTIQQQRMSNYALLAFALASILVGIGLYSAFQRKKSYNQLLEAEVGKRTAELETSNAQLKDFNQRLEQSNAELERFAYIASHDLKSPLRNVISFLNLIERRLRNNTDPDINEYLRFASENARHMHQLIQDVLEFSRVDKTGERSNVDVSESLVMVVQNLRDEMEIKNAAVFMGQLPKVEANSVQVLQLLQNLVGNGIKYNQSHRPKVLVTHREDGQNHIFIVKDNGIGIAEAYHEQIFGMFKRLHTKDEYAGTGIGLALCRKIVQNIGGRIWLESQEGKGTTFYFTVPKAA